MPPRMGVHTSVNTSPRSFLFTSCNLTSPRSFLTRNLIALHPTSYLNSSTVDRGDRISGLFSQIYYSTIVLHVHPPPGKEERGCSALVGVGGQEAKNTDSNKMPLGKPA